MSKNSTLELKLLIKGSVIALNILIERPKAARIPVTLLNIKVSCELTTYNNLLELIWVI